VGAIGTVELASSGVGGDWDWIMAVGIELLARSGGDRYGV